MHIDFNSLRPGEIYHVLTQTVIPRPIAWVLSENEDATYNLAPFSYFTPVSSKPAVLMFSVGKKSTGENKDTVTNILAGRPFSIQIASVDQREWLNNSSAELDLNESEIGKYGIDLEGSNNDQSFARVKGAKVAFECELYQHEQLGDTPQQLIFAKVLSAYCDDQVVSQDQKGRLTISAEAINPLTRLGASEYSEIGAITPLKRPS